MNGFLTGFQSLMFVFFLIFPIGFFILFFSPKLRAKFFGQQLKSVKHMVDENEELLEELNTKGANLSKEGIEIKARAVKKGFAGDSSYCKHCGSSIDSDSRFYKNCGKQQ